MKKLLKKVNNRTINSFSRLMITCHCPMISVETYYWMAEETMR